MTAQSTPPELRADLERALAVELFNRTWELLELPSRTEQQDDEMVDAAHASAWHWRNVGTPANAARAHWLCARVYATLGRAEAALLHARRAVEIVAVGGEGLEDWDAAAASEGMARALLACGNPTAAASWKQRAITELERIADPEDRIQIAADLESLPI